MLAFLDGFTKREGDVVWHVGSHHHRPAAEIDGRYVGRHAFETRLRHYGGAIAH
jgi:hypothetical protein